MAARNAARAPDIHTILLPASPSMRTVPSTLVRQIARMGGNVDPFVSSVVARKLAEKSASRATAWPQPEGGGTGLIASTNSDGADSWPTGSSARKNWRAPHHDRRDPSAGARFERSRIKALKRHESCTCAGETATSTENSWPSRCSADTLIHRLTIGP